ncbi:MAG: rhomboid family intramembrane serine protease [Gammaproteobacteria bacterium]
MLIGLFAPWPPTSAQYPYAPSFEIWQLLTYGFLHGGLTHLLFNMLALLYVRLRDPAVARRETLPMVLPRLHCRRGCHTAARAQRRAG